MLLGFEALGGEVLGAYAGVVPQAGFCTDWPTAPPAPQQKRGAWPWPAFEFIGALPRLPTGFYTDWGPAPTRVAQKVSAWPWPAFEFVEVLPPLPDIDAVYRPRKPKSKLRARPDYSIYNHPEFGRQRADEPPEEFYEDETAPDKVVAVAVVLPVENLPQAPAAPQVNPAALLPLEHIGLFSQPWAHAIAPVSQPQPPPSTTEADPDASAAFDAVLQMALGVSSNSKNMRPTDSINIEYLRRDGQNHEDIIRELRNLFYRIR